MPIYKAATLGRERAVKGVVFNLLEQAVTDAHGDDVWIDLLEEAGVEGAYTSLGSYPDSEIVALVGAAANQLEILPASAASRRSSAGTTPCAACCRPRSSLR